MGLNAIDVNSEFLDLKDQLSSYLYRLTTNKADMEDLVQDTFIRVTEKIDSFKHNSTFKTWVFTIATNLAIDNKRVKNRWEIDVQDKCKDAAQIKTNYDKIFHTFHAQPENNFEIVEHINYCFTCIAKNLSLEKQIAIILKEIYHFKRNEIAEIMKITEGVVKHLLHDGRNELQEKYHHRCAMINKNGVCYQCAELNDGLQKHRNAEEKIAKLDLSPNYSPEKNLDTRFELINRINPLKSNGSALEDTILQILRETIQDN